MVSFFVWLSISLGFFVLELSSLTLVYFLSFAGAALITAMLSLVLFDHVHQTIAFFALSVIIILILRRLLHPHHYKTHPTNIDALIGKRGLVTQNIAPSLTGQVTVDNQPWSARAPENTVIIQGATVQVIGVQGCHLIVKEIKQT